MDLQGRGRGFLPVHVGVVVLVGLVALAQVLDDPQVVAGRLGQAVLQDPAVRLQLRVAQQQHVLHGRLQVAHPQQHQQLQGPREPLS